MLYITYIIFLRWFGKCWHIQDLLKYEFDIEFDVSAHAGFNFVDNYLWLGDCFALICEIFN